MVGSMAVVGMLTRCAKIHTMCGLKTTQMNFQRSLIPEHKPYDFELGQNAVKVIKDIYCAKVKGQLITIE